MAFKPIPKTPSKKQKYVPIQIDPVLPKTQQRNFAMFLLVILAVATVAIIAVYLLKSLYLFKLDYGNRQQDVDNIINQY